MRRFGDQWREMGGRFMYSRAQDQLISSVFVEVLTVLYCIVIGHARAFHRIQLYSLTFG